MHFYVIIKIIVGKWFGLLFRDGLYGEKCENFIQRFVQPHPTLTCARQFLSRAAPASICYQVPNYVIAIYRNYGCITTNHERRSIMNNIIICFSFTGIQRSCWGNHYHLKGVVWYNATSLYKLSTLLYEVIRIDIR